MGTEALFPFELLSAERGWLATLLAFAGGCLAAVLAVELLALARVVGHGRASRASRLLVALVDVLSRPGKEGRDPNTDELRRVLLASSLTALTVVGLALGLFAGVLAGCAAPLVVARALRTRRERYQAAIADGAPQLASALADALSGGHSVRGAILEAAVGIEGPAGIELRRTANELTLGARTDDALEGLRRRARCHEIDTIVAGVLLQRRAGGDLARLLRDSARAFEDQKRLMGEVRAATAQARFTGLIVVLLPVGGGILVELASPGFIGRLASEFLTAWLLGIALVLQAFAAVAIRRFGRVRA